MTPMQDPRASAGDAATSDAPGPLTDSAWFWFALFLGVGLAALLATGGKFQRRQATIERKYQARAAVAAGMEVQTDGAGQRSAVAVPEYSQPGQLIIPLWPIQLTLALLLTGSVAMLIRERTITR